MEQNRLFFKKKYRLCSHNLISELFQKGNSFILYPFRIIYYKTENTDEKVPFKVIFSIPKRKFKKAVDRNLLKRRCREAYRLNKKLFYHNEKKQYVIAFIYISDKINSFSFIEQAIIKIGSKIKFNQ